MTGYDSMLKQKADYWVSNDRKFCDYCKCWITDNKISVSFHENGKRHKAAVAQRITQISRNSVKAEKEKMKMDQDIRKMEDAALKSYAKDISSYGDITANSINAVIAASNSNNTIGPSQLSYGSPTDRNPVNVATRQIDPLRLPGNSDDEDDSNRPNVRKTAIIEQEENTSSLWVEAKTDDNNTYYWNVKTNESVWVAPKEGFMPINEYNKINEIAMSQQRMKIAKDTHSYRENVDEEVAKYNREKLKNIRKIEVEKVAKEKEKVRETFKTEEDLVSPEMGQWQTVVKKEENPIDWQLPEINTWIPPPVISHSLYEPRVKQFKEKTITSSDQIGDSSTSSTFRKRKIPRGNTRQRLDTDD